MPFNTACPVCKKYSVVPILYGNQEHQALDLAYMGWIRLGGSITMGELAYWFCESCRAKFPLAFEGIDGDPLPIYTAELERLFANYLQMSSVEVALARAQNGACLAFAWLFPLGVREVRLLRTNGSMTVHVRQDEGWLEVDLPITPTRADEIIKTVGDHPTAVIGGEPSLTVHCDGLALELAVGKSETGMLLTVRRGV